MTRKITLSAAKIKLGLQETLTLGDVDAERDWGYARDFVQAMWLMLQQEEADDFVLATGKSHSIRELLDIAFQRVGLNWKDHVVESDRFKRPVDPTQLLGDPTKARDTLGWNSQVDFEQLVHLMVDNDLELLQDAAR